MNLWPRRIAYFFAVVVWLVLMSLPLTAFALAARNQLQWGDTGGNHVRLFLVQESGAEGIGLEMARTASDSPTCLETRVRYLMWAGAPDNVTFCQCVDVQSGAALSATPGACGE